MLEYTSSANEKWVCIIREWKEILFYPTNTKKTQKKPEQTEHKTEKWTTLIQVGQKQTNTLAD